MSNDKYVYEVNGTNYEILFRRNGSLNKISAKNNGQSIVSTYYYRNKEDMFPYKSNMLAGGQSVTAMFSELHQDSIGNVVKLVQTSLGQSVIITSKIEYY